MLLFSSQRVEEGVGVTLDIVLVVYTMSVDTCGPVVHETLLMYSVSGVRVLLVLLFT